MYCFTRIKGTAKMLVASMDFDCAHCKKKGGIKKGEKFFWIDGYRTYERLHFYTNESGEGEHYGPYVPFGVLKEKKLKLWSVDPLTFKDFIPRKMCFDCFANFHRFVSCGRTVPPLLEEGKKLSFSLTHTKRVYSSLKEYHCLMCKERIPVGTSYVRFGHYNCYCKKCIDSVLPIIGSEFSHYR